jgi:uncharacterized membrane protein
LISRPWLDPWRRGLQLALGVIWLLDAALQYQPYMFTRAFPDQRLAPVGPGNPGWVAHPVHWVAHLTASHVVILDAVFATVQLLIALGLFTRPTVRIALAGSVIWSLGIWWLGEGLGGLLVAPQSPIAGAPGVAPLYAVISILIWPRDDTGRPTADPTASVAFTSPLRRVGSRLVWLALWGGFAVESLQAVNRAPSALHDMIAGMADGEPGWLRAIDRHSANVLAHHGTEISVVLAIVFALIALAIFGDVRVVRVGLVVAAVLAALIWVVGENIGEIATGKATDPNTGLVLILLAATYWPITKPPEPLLHTSTTSTTSTQTNVTLSPAKS